MRNNPLAGPAYVVALANALVGEQRPGAYVTPPPTGGEQISVRLGESLMVHLDVVSKKADWTRAQVLTAVIGRGLFDLYDFVSDETGEAIMEEIANELVPEMHSETSLMKEAKRIMKEVGGDDCTLSPGARPESFWVIAPRQSKGKIPRMLVRIDSQAADDFQNTKPSQREPMAKKMRRLLATEWSGAIENAGTEPNIIVKPGSLL